MQRLVKINALLTTLFRWDGFNRGTSRVQGVNQVGTNVNFCSKKTENFCGPALGKNRVNYFSATPKNVSPVTRRDRSEGNGRVREGKGEPVSRAERK
jgi:hypothetical protein